MTFALRAEVPVLAAITQTLSQLTVTWPQLPEVFTR